MNLRASLASFVATYHEIAVLKADHLAMDLEKYSYRILFTAAVVLLVVGTIFFHAVERLSWLNAYYFCVVTLSTVGYGDIVPTTQLGKFGATIYILIGVGIIAAFLQATARRREIRREDRIQKRQDAKK